MPLKFCFVRGAENIGKDERLKSGPDGSGQLYSMHEYVVPTLLRLVGKKNLEQRWADREVTNNYEYYAGYLYDDETGEVKSIVSGTITKDETTKDETMRFTNTATSPDLRKDGFLTATIAQLILHCNENRIVNKFDATVSSQIKAEGGFAGLDFAQIKDAVAAINSRQTESSPENTRLYGERIGKLMTSAEETSPIIYGTLKADSFGADGFWNLPKFQMLRGLVEKAPGDLRMILEVGSDSKTVTFVPKVELTRELVGFCEDLLTSFKEKHPIASSEVSSVDAARGGEASSEAPSIPSGSPSGGSASTLSAGVDLGRKW
jgi:hypothetical protein